MSLASHQRLITRKSFLLCSILAVQKLKLITSPHPPYITSNEQFGVLQVIDQNNFDEAEKFISHWKAYMINEVMEKPQFEGVRDRCKNQHEMCSFWSQIGECAKNPRYMRINCAPACMSCHELDFNKRCAMDSNVKNAFEVRPLCIGSGVHCHLTCNTLLTIDFVLVNSPETLISSSSE